ncbi:hypothetical protein AM2_107 [Lactococcus phage AM2]|uniref:Uncharacterized protein n=8 Tax=Audreyjarvisvirus TaxID=2843351 RepID=A0A1W6JLP9_9CAUD|nr:hypothetical protein H1Z30_gp164 [Lactococcus phage AM1]YP_009905259.1 hypothetical protein H1Z34_gp159 [Lactococcus phage LW81]ARM66412.1 hypothetical protein AM2_107 [Lactococcus phage AM2]ARM66589.1 hypothetical protein AM3_107 [Lactococcus phage AM3]ARM67142.1 hypothetical protein AM8_107 [Lactococcus phage AM8]ARM67321.1 hypothetical protein AM9_108 [Lactococcus phage AM9]ARM67499.1 hypothetical protein AM11_107 [Lactococcus phage AM11]ARQ95687.1 hypothetical protein AM12_108 [Lactoc
MNLLEEHYIVEVIREKPFKTDWTQQHKDKFIKIEMIVNVHGRVFSTHKIFTVDRWKEVWEQGFYIANYKGGV